MTIPLIRATGEFAVARPIPWDEDDTLRDHVDSVINALTEADRVVEVDAEAQLDEGQVRLAIIVAGVEEENADRSAREALAVSIRMCEGRHFQLLPPDEEAALLHNVPSRSGLLSPLWRLRRLAIEPVEEG